MHVVVMSDVGCCVCCRFVMIGVGCIVCIIVGVRYAGVGVVGIVGVGCCYTRCSCCVGCVS